MYAMEKSSVRSLLGKLSARARIQETPIDGWMYTSALTDELGKAEKKENPCPILPNTCWEDEAAFFEADAITPSWAQHYPLYLRFRNGGENLLRISGRAIAGFDANHEYTLLQAMPGEKISLQVEAAHRWQHLAHARQFGMDPSPQIFLGASFCALDPDILYIRDLLQCLLDFDLCHDWITEIRRLVHPDAPLPQVQVACRALRQEFSQRILTASQQKSQQFLLSGHSHLDLGYLWPIKETRRKALRTFSSMLALMDEFPEFTFFQSQTVLYEWVQQDDPALFERIKERIREGRWQVAGGMYVESDGNIPSPESMIRQFLYGVSYAETELGVHPRIAFLPDTFGLSAALPQIFRGCGMEMLYTAKIRSNAFFEFPFTHYQWEGIDGSRIPAHLCPFGTYSGDLTAFQVKGGMQISQKTGVDPSLPQPYLIGFGDGGGGTTREMIQYARILTGLPGLPAMQFRPGDDTFQPLIDQKDSLPVWREEMYYDVHQGTLTSQTALKMDNRLLESAFFRAEWLDCVSGAVHHDTLRQGWKTLLLHQFHDILPGSCQKSVFDQAHEEQQALLNELHAIEEDCLSRLLAPAEPQEILLFNPLPQTRKVQFCHQGKWIDETLPPLSLQQAHPSPLPFFSPLASQNIEAFILDNGLIRATIHSQTGWITGLYSYPADREMLSAPARFVLHDELYEFYDAWNFDKRTLEKEIPLPTPCMTLVENSGIRALLRIHQPLSSESYLICDLILERGNPRLDMHIQLQWQECGRMLRFQVPSSLYARQAQYDLGYGFLHRSTGSTMAFEKAQIEASCRRWMDLSDASAGLALMNIGKYGGIVKENTLFQTLLKAPRYPDDQADLGNHAFTLSLYPHTGSCGTGQVDQQAAALENPVRILEGYRSLRKEQLFPWQDRPGVGLGAIKRSHDGSGDIILRLYERQGGVWQFPLDLSPLQPKAIWQCSMLEKKEALLPLDNGQVQLSFTPFQIITLRIQQ